MSISLAFYKVDTAYCDYLRQFDSKVPHNFNEKTNRPFVGVVIEHEGLKHKYYIPLTSPKPKHKIMKNNLDFHKIDSGNLGALNFNNMIPVTDDTIIKIDPSKMSTNTKEDLAYKTLLENQLSWCNANKELIVKKAVRLHEMVITGKAPESIVDRSCNFLVLEQASKEWSINHKNSKSYTQKENYKSMDHRLLDIEAYKKRNDRTNTKNKKDPEHDIER